MHHAQQSDMLFAVANNQLVKLNMIWSGKIISTANCYFLSTYYLEHACRVFSRIFVPAINGCDYISSLCCFSTMVITVPINSFFNLIKNENLSLNISNKKQKDVPCKMLHNSFFKNLPILTSLQLQGFKWIKKHTSLCNTDAKPNINVNVSGQRVHQHRALADSGSLGWS